jgi:hypothetical protein
MSVSRVVFSTSTEQVREAQVRARRAAQHAAAVERMAEAAFLAMVRREDAERVWVTCLWCGDVVPQDEGCYLDCGPLSAS